MDEIITIIEEKIGSFDPIQPHNEEKIDQIIVTKSDWPTQPHNGKNIDKTIVSQDISYAVTYSKDDNSVRGWLVNVEENGRQQQDVYFKLDKSYKIDIDSFVLYEKMLLFRYDDDSRPGLIDLSDDKGRFIQLKHAERISIYNKNSIGFLPNGDLTIVSLRDYKVYLYSFMNKPTNATLWDYSQIYDIEIHENLKEHSIICLVYQTKLLLFSNNFITQWDLLSMTIKMQYNVIGDLSKDMIVINKNQTLLAFFDSNDGATNIYSMETGVHVSKYGPFDHYCYIPVEFVTLKDGSEGLIVKRYGEDKYKFLDPFHPSDAIDITNDIITDDEYFIITDSNKKFYIKENNVWVTDWLKEDTFQRMLNTAHHSNIYNLSTFKTIRNMLDDVIGNKITDCVIPEDAEFESKDDKLFQFIPRRKTNWIEVEGFKKSQNNDWNKTLPKYVDDVLSFEQLDNQDLALVTKDGIYIYTIVENSLVLRYFWNNEKWEKNIISNNDGRLKILQEILDDEFKDLPSSLLSPNFMVILKRHMQDMRKDKHDRKYVYMMLIKSIINDPVELSKFGSKILEMAIELNEKDFVQLIYNKIIFFSMMALLPIISIKLPELIDHHHSSLVMKYILHTSILLDPSCSTVKDSTNTSLYAYSKVVYIKKSTLSSYFKSLFSSFKIFKILNPFSKRQETPTTPTVPTISFIVPFPQICNYQDKDKLVFDDEANVISKSKVKDYNPWNEFLYKPKSILFCNNWWNFAAIVDFKWKTFGKFYYYQIWFFYTIFCLCFALASILPTTDFYYRKIFFIISILLGFIHLYFEIRQCLWKRDVYFKDPWNLFDIGAYSLPIITSIYWLINGPSSQEIVKQITAISILLLTFKFILFFRVFRSYGKYFSIILGVAEEVFPFLVVLCFIILGFGFSFFILLRPNTDISIPAFNDDDNNPWNLATKYNSISSSDESIDTATTFIKTPDSNTNMFSWFHTSILAMYLLLAGDSSSLSSWTYHENPIMTFLLFAFTFTTTIYLMNLFIGLLNMAIENYNKDEEFLLLKARIIVEIELFYMLPYQRHKKEWFPDWIYYDMPVEEVHKLINAIDDKKTEFSSPPFISKKLRELVGIPEPIELQHQIEKIENNLKQTNDELKQQIQDMKELLSCFIKNSSVNNNI